MFRMVDLPSAYPLRDLFDAAVRNRNIKLTCQACHHATIFDGHALWWLFKRRAWADRFPEVQRRMVCTVCFYRRSEKLRSAKLELVEEEPTETSLALPSELDWKRELRRRR
jgi:ribosomal protein L44E